jgi:hypothetical protein
MKSEAFRDDLAACCSEPVGDAAVGFVRGLAVSAGANLIGCKAAIADSQLGYVAAGATNLAECAFAGIETVTSTDGVIPAGSVIYSAGSALSSHVHNGTTAAVTSAPVDVGQAVAEIIADLKAMVAEMGAPSYFTGDFEVKMSPASAEDRAARKSGVVTLSIGGRSAISQPVDTDDENRYSAWFTEGVRTSDEPGISAMAAKAAQPTPEPVLSVLGQQVTQSELAAALQLVRQKSAPAEKETPRGLMCVRDFDHRLGAWRG